MQNWEVEVIESPTAVAPGKAGPQKCACLEASMETVLSSSGSSHEVQGYFKAIMAEVWRMAAVS